MAKYYVLARLFLDSGTEYLSEEDVTHPTRTYDGRVLNWGMIDRSIPVPAGIPHVSDSHIRIADTDRAWRDLSVTTPLRRRFVDLKIVAHGASESAAETIFRGEIVDYDFGPAYIELTIKNRAFAWMDEEIPAFINEQNYGLGVKRAFLNIIQGQCISTITDEPGAVPCPHIKWDSVAGDRFGLAAHPCEEVVAVYRKVPTKASSSDPDWMLVPPIEYNIGTEVDREFDEVPGIPFNPAYLDFVVEQEPGTLIRADVKGINYRGPWPDLSGIPEAIGFEVNRHPINYLINMIYLIMHKAGTTADVWEVSSFEDLLDIFENFIPDSGTSTGFTRFRCDGAITEVMTVREWLGQFCQSTQIQILEKVNGKLAVAYVGDTDPDRPVFKEGYHFILNSFKERAAQPTVNQTHYHYARHYGANEFEFNEIFNNEADQLILGKPQIDTSTGEPELDSNGDVIILPQIEKDDVDLWFVRDELTALYITGRRMNFLALGSMRQEWKMPLTAAINDIELGKLVGITHAMGAAVVGGYDNVEVAITNITIDLMRLMVTVRSVLRVPVAIVPPAGLTCCLPLDMLETALFPDGIQTPYKSTGVAYNPAENTNFREGRWEVSFERNTNVDTHTFDLLDAASVVYSSLSFPAGPVNNYISRQDIAFTPALTSKNYRLRVNACSTPGCHLQQSRLWICFDEAPKLAIPRRMIGGDESTGGFGADAPQNDYFAYAVSAGGTTYGYGPSGYEGNFGIYLKDESKFATISGWRLSANGWTDTGDDGGIALFNKTTNQMVAGTEIAWSNNTVPETKSIDFSNSATNFTNLNEFEVRIKGNGGFYTSIVDLWVILTNATKAEIYVKLSGHRTADGEYRTKFNTSEYPDAVGYSFEACARLTGYVRVKDVGVSDDTNPGGTVLATLNFTGPRERKRTTITPVNGNRLIPERTADESLAFIIVELNRNA